MWDEFKKFITRGNMIDLAIGFTVGVAFTAVVKSAVNDVIMPPIGLALGGVDFAQLFIVLEPGTPPPSYDTIAAAQAAGAVTLNYGVFINSIVSFLIIAVVVFLVVRTINRMRERRAARVAQTESQPAEPTDQVCPFCFFTIPIKATRCPHCTSELEGEAEPAAV